MHSENIKVNGPYSKTLLDTKLYTQDYMLTLWIAFDLF